MAALLVQSVFLAGLASAQCVSDDDIKKQMIQESIADHLSNRYHVSNG